GTVTARVPPGFRTRASSAAAASSSGMCSITSAAMIRAKVAAGNGRRWPSPTTPAPSPPAGAWPSSTMASHMDRQSPMSAALKSVPTTRAPPREGPEGGGAVAGPEVEQEPPRPQAEPVVVDGQHGRLLRSAATQAGLLQADPVLLQGGLGGGGPAPVGVP